MIRSINYTVASSYYRVGVDDGVRVRFDVTAACNMPAKIFAYRQYPVNPATGEKAGAFSHVCSPVDLTEYPEDTPVPGQQPSWFRLAFVDVLVRSMAEADELVANIRLDIAALRDTLNVADTLIGVANVQLGTDVCSPAVSSSSSSSTGSSEESSESLTAYTLAAVGTLARAVGPGVAWVTVGAGAGSGHDDGSYSTVTLRSGQASQSLVIQGFDFSSLPHEAEIEGIEVTVWARELAGSSTSSEGFSESACHLSPELPVVPGPALIKFFSLHQPALGRLANRAADEAIHAGSFTAITAGADDDLWGSKDWTATLIKSGEFGVILALGTALSTPLAEAAIDGAEITIHYRA